MTGVVAYRLNELAAGVAINVRPGQDDVADLVASIRAHGLLQPLVGRKRDDDKIEIIDGNRRLAALNQIDTEDDAADVTTIEWVDVVLRDPEPDADAFEISLAANILRKPLHPVAEYEAFVQLAERGKTNDDIAAHFGITLRQVEQRQALGRLHPDVRKAWLEGRINGDSARAFTLASQADQAAYLAKGDRWNLEPHAIRHAFTQAAVPADRGAALFVGEDAYRAAGGEMVADLFAEKRQFADGGLLQRLADEKLAAEAQALKQAEGWGEVLFGAAANESYRWQRITKPALPAGEKPTRRIEIETRLQEIDTRGEEIEGELEEAGFDDEVEPTPGIAALLAEQDALEAERDPLSREHATYDDDRAAWMTLPEARRAKAIAVVAIGHDGALSIARGFVRGKPEAKPAPHTAMAAPKRETSGGETEAPEPTRLSATLLDDLALTATRAAAHVIAVEPRIAFAAMVTGFICRGTPLKIALEGGKQGPELPWDPHAYPYADSGEVFRHCLALPDEELHRLIAAILARGLDFTAKASAGSYPLKPEAVTDLRASLPAQAHRAALVQAFDPAAYFSAAPKPEALAAIADCGDEPAKYAKLKKADLGAAATRLATAHLWLPPLLRGEVFAAIDTPPEPENTPEPEAPAEVLPPAEQQLSAAEAAQRIWQDQDAAANPAGFDAESWFGSQKAPAIRAALKEMEQPAPVGWTKAQLVALAVRTAAEKGWRPADMAEAA